VPTADDPRITSSQPGGGETILVVEDEPAMLEVTRRILDQNGYEVLTAGCGLEAIRIVEEHHGDIDLLLSDVVMPQMLGREVAERVTCRFAPRPRCCSCPATPQAVILRAQDFDGSEGFPDGRMGNLADGRALIDKPFTEAALLARLRTLFASREAL